MAKVTDDLGADLAKRLIQLNEAVVNATSKSKICMAGALVIERYAKEDDEIPVVTGYLQSTTYAREAQDGESAEVISEADYAWYVHMGTEKQAAQPYFDNTIANREEEIIVAINNQAQEEIDKAMRKGG